MSRVVAVSPADKRKILMLFAATRRAFARHLDDDDEVVSAAFSWTGWHATATYKIKAPLARCAIALGLDAETAAQHISAYRRIEAREPDKCKRAQADYVDFYRQSTGEDLSGFIPWFVP